MIIKVKNVSSNEIIDVDTDYISTVEILTISTLKVTLNNKMVYILEYHPELLKKAPIQLNIFGNDLDKGINRGEEKKLKGIKKAVDHANIKNAGTWFEKAYEASKLFIKSKPTGYAFMMEDIRSWVEIHNLVPPPPSKRAWGAVPVRLRKGGLIQSVGKSTVKNENAHRCYANVWAKI